MPSEFEESVEVAHELIREEVSRKTSRWIEWVAISTMVMALFSALGALLAASTSNELMIKRTKEILEVSQLNADRTDIEILKSKHVLLESLGKKPEASDVERIKNYSYEIRDLKTDAESKERQITLTLYEHELFGIGVTLLSIAITLSGMAVVIKEKKIWFVGLMFAALGTSFLGAGLFKMLL